MTERVCKVRTTGRWTPLSRVYGWTSADFAALLGIPRDRFKELVYDGEVDPTNLESICAAWLLHVRNPRYNRLWDVQLGAAELARVEQRREKVEVQGKTLEVAAPLAEKWKKVRGQ